MARLIRILVLALLLAAPSARADSLDSLLSAHAEAMGLSRDTVDPGCWHVVEELQGLGLTGRSESWVQAPAFMRSRLQLGPLDMEIWFDGNEGWLSDRNGAAREAQGNELDGMLVQALFSTGAWLLESPPVPLAFRLNEEDSTDSTLVLICQPLLEKPLHIELHRETLLPVSTTFRSANGNQIQHYLEWTWQDGDRIPQRSRLEIDGLLEMDSRLIRAERIPTRPPRFFQPDQREPGLPRDVRFDSAIVEAPLLEDGLHLTIQGAISAREGEPVPIVLLVDTGAGANFLDSGAADRLGLEGEGVVPTIGIGGHAKSSFVHVDSLRIGSVAVYDQSWMASDFSGIQEWFEHPPVVVLGYDFLSRTVLEVDYGGRVIRFHDPSTFEAPEGALGLPLRMDGNIPSVEVEIEGHPGWLHVDTGSNSGLDLAKPFVEAFELLEGRVTAPAGGLKGVGGVASSRLGKVESLALGDLVLEDVPTGFNDAEQGIFAREDVAGILGAAVLSRFRCWFDYPGRTLWLVEE
jgi:hypothetical protein